MTSIVITNSNSLQVVNNDGKYITANQPQPQPPSHTHPFISSAAVCLKSFGDRLILLQESEGDEEEQKENKNNDNNNNNNDESNSNSNSSSSTTTPNTPYYDSTYQVNDLKTASLATIKQWMKKYGLEIKRGRGIDGQHEFIGPHSIHSIFINDSETECALSVKLIPNSYEIFLFHNLQINPCYPLRLPLLSSSTGDLFHIRNEMPVRKSHSRYQITTPTPLPLPFNITISALTAIVEHTAGHQKGQNNNNKKSRMSTTKELMQRQRFCPAEFRVVGYCKGFLLRRVYDKCAYYRVATGKWVYCDDIRQITPVFGDFSTYFTFHLPDNQFGVCFGGVNYMLVGDEENEENEDGDHDDQTQSAVQTENKSSWLDWATNLMGDSTATGTANTTMTPKFVRVEIRDGVTGLNRVVERRTVRLHGGQSVFVIVHNMLYELKWQQKKKESSNTNSNESERAVCVMERHLPWIRNCWRIYCPIYDDSDDGKADALLIRATKRETTIGICVYYPRKKMFCWLVDYMTSEVQNMLKGGMESVLWMDNKQSPPLLFIQTKKNGCFSLNGNMAVNFFTPYEK